MHTTRCSGHISPAMQTTPATHVPVMHAPLPHMSPVMHAHLPHTLPPPRTPYHASPGMYAPQPQTPHTTHALRLRTEWQTGIKTSPCYITLLRVVKIFVIIVKCLEPAAFCVKDQDVSAVPVRHLWETGSLNWLQFMLQWFIRVPESIRVFLKLYENVNIAIFVFTAWKPKKKIQWQNVTPSRNRTRASHSLWF